MEDRLLKILNAIHSKNVKRSGLESIHTKDFPEAYQKTAIDAMKAAYNLALDDAIKMFNEKLKV